MRWSATACATISTRCASDDRGAAARRSRACRCRSRPRAGTLPGAARRDAQGRGRRHRRRGRRIGLRQDGPGARHPRLGRQPAASWTAAACCSRAATCWRSSEEALRRLRGRDIALTTPEPRKHLNPLMTVGAPDRQRGSGACRHAEAAGAWNARSTSCATSASPIRRAASRPIRTSCPAACASA